MRQKITLRHTRNSIPYLPAYRSGRHPAYGFISDKFTTSDGDGDNRYAVGKAFCLSADGK